ncbi:MAG TPA: AMP-binding protein [Terrimicrobiaceae bacterium]
MNIKPPVGGEGAVVWRPTPGIVERSNLRHFMDQHGIGSLNELQDRSTTDLEWFWNAALRGLDIRFYERYEKVVDLSRGPEWAQWCVGGRMNIVHNCLDKYAGTPEDARIALRWEGEEGKVRTLTYAELRAGVAGLAAGLASLGLAKGDAMAVFMPLTPECVIAMLAIMKIGGIFLPLFSGFGVQAIVSRLRDADARVLFIADGFFRRGKLVPMKPAADEAADQVPTIEHVVVCRRTGCQVAWNPRRDRWWHEMGAAAPVASALTSAEDPLMIIYTSGTTGRPKGAVHTHCGFPVKAAQDMWHGLDLHADETLFWITDIGWMMGPWLVFGTLLLGATMMLYDGAPDFPHSDRLWQLVERHRVTTLGISPTLVRALIRHGDAPVRAHDLSSLRKFGSTGEPWNPDPWIWLFQTVGGGTRPIINYSGGTEISGGILMGNVLTPLKPCAFSGPLPGMAAEVVNERGESVRGEVGELVIRQPWIGMTRGFWRDPQRYLDTYWSRFPGTWVHGDWAVIDADGQWFILGRSDDTIKSAGKRLGPAEVESLLVAHPAVSEAAAIGVPDAVKGEALICFCVLKPGYVSDDALRSALQVRVSGALGKPLAPREVKFVRDLPRTRNAKVMRRIIRAAWLGEEAGDVSALENPTAVEEVRRAV